MFCLLGTLYIINGFSAEKKEHKIIYIICGLSIIVISFVSRTFLTNILSVIAILTPIIVRRITAKSI